MLYFSSNPDVTVRKEFECMYILEESKNNTPHLKLNAHRYKIEVSVSRSKEYQKESSKLKVIEFEKLQRMLNSILPYNKYIYSTTSRIPRTIGDILRNSGGDCIEVDFEISAEALCIWIVNNLQDKLNSMFNNDHLIVTNAVLKETNSCYVNWHNESI